MSNPNKIEFLRGKSKWANVIVPGKFAKWTIDLNLDNDSLTKVLAWKKEGIQNHITKDDDGYWVTISRPIKWKGRDGVEQPMAPPSVLNADNTVYTGTKIGNGSDVEVKVELRSFTRSEEHTSELQSLTNLVCRLLLEKKKKTAATRSLSHQ